MTYFLVFVLLISVAMGFFGLGWLVGMNDADARAEIAAAVARAGVHAEYERVIKKAETRLDEMLERDAKGRFVPRSGRQDA